MSNKTTISKQAQQEITNLRETIFALRKELEGQRYDKAVSVQKAIQRTSKENEQLKNTILNTLDSNKALDIITIDLDTLDKYDIRIVDASLINPHEGDVPKNFKLHDNFPNPFNPFTKINYDIPDKNFVEIIIYNLGGGKVATLSSEIKDSGTYSAHWNGRNSYGKEVGTGIYIYQLIADNYRITKKMLLLK